MLESQNQKNVVFHALQIAENASHSFFFFSPKQFSNINKKQLILQWPKYLVLEEQLYFDNIWIVILCIVM